MPRPEGTKGISYHLPHDHQALGELDSYCREWDKSLADATKDIVIAWAKARRGDLSALSGLLGIPLGTTTPTRHPPQDHLTAEKEVKLKRSASRNAQSVDLDL